MNKMFICYRKTKRSYNPPIPSLFRNFAPNVSTSNGFYLLSPYLPQDTNGATGTVAKRTGV